MRLRRGLQFLLVALVSVIFSACATYPRTGTEALAGTWTNRFGTVWVIDREGAFDVDLNHNGKRDAWGTYTVAGDTVTIVGTGGLAAKGCKGNGVYRFTRGSDTLRFTRIHDNCEVRVRNLMLVWHRK